MKKSQKSLLGTVFIFIVAIILTGCSTGTSSTTQKSKKDEQIIVKIALNGKMSPLTIGREKGWFEEELAPLNAKVEWSEFTSGPPLLESLAANHVDLSYLGDGALIAGLDKNLPFEVIAQTSTGKSNVRIITPKDSKINSIEDLKGKKVGVASGTTGHVYLAKALKYHGLTLDDVKIINLQPDDAQSAFETKQLDAWTVWEPYITNTVEKGMAKEIKVEGEILAPGAIIARAGFAKEYPEIVEAYLRAYKKAADWRIEHPDEAAEIYAKVTKIPVETIKKIITADEPDIFFSKESIKAQQESIETLVEVGYIKNEFSFEERINYQYIDEAFKK
ncbi:ABC transporter substrate-binding protein [Niallia endozanthoxylica]|uniref:Putative aliphatic sulfonates-binding protein n=1 Tax=Niallia endozanthoxylica TaxID=2036016 RepID=A0A5J5HZP5_9BACI|nr:aliphatic sulfonate ABC transporter substrate-binding protein [Niallia endozanthoxylica]KAA9027600.1 aliphatic sulfonate ABC transporter substrate-binding protein [Niallia endozanthoxylica]